MKQRWKWALIGQAMFASLFLFGSAASAGLVLVDKNGEVLTLPDFLVRSADVLLDEYSLADESSLRTKEFLGALCASYNCGQLNEDQARKLLEIHFQRVGADSKRFAELREFGLKTFSGLLSLGAIVISFLSYRHSTASKRAAKATKKSPSSKTSKPDQKTDSP